MKLLKLLLKLYQIFSSDTLSSLMLMTCSLHSKSAHELKWLLHDVSWPEWFALLLCPGLNDTSVGEISFPRKVWEYEQYSLVSATSPALFFFECAKCGTIFYKNNSDRSLFLFISIFSSFKIEIKRDATLLTFWS